MAFPGTNVQWMEKALNSTFQDRVRVELMKQSTYHLQQAGDSDQVHDYCRLVRALIWQDWFIKSSCLHLLASVGSEDIDDDAALNALVNSKFFELAPSAVV